MTGLLTRLNPLVLIGIGVAAALGSPAIRTLPVALLAVALWVVAAVLTVPSWRYPAFCLLLVLIPMASVAWSTWLLGGHELEVAVVAGLRTFVLAWPGAVAVGYVDVARLGDYLAQSLKVPGRFAAALSAALQRVAGSWRTWHDLERTRRARGLKVRPWSMAFALLVHTIRDATRTSIAMDARGFATAQRRTWAEPADWIRADVAVLFGAVVLALVPAAISLMSH
ncbi:energy-coupling factor transporter transmembrane component T family protein [Aeromicrobium choanae]|uniref:Energy-coupling factor transport system permease protein n=1 Tax=Aeromicrobium choanae TaxID=1736691 RepID=A0A1T4Z118_9ACTN|nr:energy-coupling factor transporter transmembrane component T [Aeromicrobium choanae]SKB07724.1 energy-coupling factor transport system permease protein [Aeromicrobium choanae]